MKALPVVVLPLRAVACGGAVVVVAFSLDAVPADAIPLVVQLLTILLLKVLLL